MLLSFAVESFCAEQYCESELAPLTGPVERVKKFINRIKLLRVIAIIVYLFEEQIIDLSIRCKRYEYLIAWIKISIYIKGSCRIFVEKSTSLSDWKKFLEKLKDVRSFLLFFV